MLAEAVRLALDVDGDRPVQEPVEDGGGHDLVGEDLAPGAPGLVRGHDHRLGPVVALGDDLEEEGRPILRATRELKLPVCEQ